MALLSFIFENMPLPIRIINRSPFTLPQYSTEGSSGMDLRAHLEAPVVLRSLERYLVPTGLFIELPEGFEAQVRPRSGLAIQQGLTCLNTPGTVDSDYRGEIRVILVNLSAEEQTIQPGDRIAQLVIQKVEKAAWQEVEIVGETSRGNGGLGSTGKH